MGAARAQARLAVVERRTRAQGEGLLGLGLGGRARLGVPRADVVGFELELQLCGADPQGVVADGDAGPEIDGGPVAEVDVLGSSQDRCEGVGGDEEAQPVLVLDTDRMGAAPPKDVVDGLDLDEVRA